MRALLARASVVIAAFALQACASLATVHTAHVVRPGETKLAANASLVGGGIPGLTLGNALGVDDPALRDVGVPVAQVEAEVRHGFAPRWDAGMRVFLTGVAGDVKFQFLQRESWDAAFAPGFSTSYINFRTAGVRQQFGELDVTLPVLFGRRFGRSSSVVFGPKVQGRFSFNAVDSPEVQGQGTRFILLAGGTGVLNLSLGRGWSLPLELSAYRDWTESSGYAYSAGIGLAVTSDPRPMWMKRKPDDEE